MRKIITILSLIILFGCSETKKETKKIVSNNIRYTVDNHSFAKPNEAIAKHLILDIKVDFNKKIISGKATYKIEKKANVNQIHFDIKALKIHKVTINNYYDETDFILVEGDEIHGDDLVITLPKKASAITIFYETTKKTEALQFIDAKQTAGKEEPFLFTQSKAILTRTWIPIQDSPQIRITYDATVEVPYNLMAVMSAKNSIRKTKNGVYGFTMKQAIPPHLIALAVGDLEYKTLNYRTGVYAERTMIEKAALEFEDIETMLKRAEMLFGKYQWEQSDIVVLPASFSSSGIENPKLTFITPKIITGDKSLTKLIIHELAHSWSGNLVTNATWNDFWINEGFTVYFERRIIEAIYGKEYANMLAIIGRQDLDKTLKSLQYMPSDTKLKFNLDSRNPNKGMSNIAYEKGFLFLKTLEVKVGRPNMDIFLKQFYKEYAFSTITTEKFVNYLNANLLTPNKIDFNTEEWIYEAGIPKNQIKITSKKFDEVMQVIEKWKSGKIYTEEICDLDWNILQKIYFTNNIPKTISTTKLKKLENSCHFTNTIHFYNSLQKQ